MRYIVKEQDGRCVLIAPHDMIIISWIKGKFNDTQDVDFLGDIPDATTIAIAMREIGDYLAENYKELL